jgi:hypothetical protein
MRDTLHKTFNKQAEYIGRGNVIGTCQVSNYIRPADELECNGRTNPRGHLQSFDLALFKNAPRNVMADARIVADVHGKAILYKVRHWRGTSEIIDGWIITDGVHGHCRTFQTGRGEKCASILAHVRAIVAED